MAKVQLRTFLVKLFAVLLPVALAIGVLNHFYVNGYYYRDVYHEIDKMLEVPDEIQMVNLGSSHGLATFRYPEDGVVRYNLALSGEDLFHDFATLRHFSSHLAKGCIVALPVSYFSFCMSNEEPSQKRYYAYLDREELRGFSYETLINAKYIPVLRSGEFIIKDLIKDQELDVGAAMMEDRTDDPVPESAADAAAQEPAAEPAFDAAKDAELRAHAKGRAESWRAGYMNAGRVHIRENMQILTEMVRFCYENGFRPVLVSTPIYEALNEQFTQEELQTCYFDPMAEVQAATGAPFLDLSHDAVLSNEPAYYGNSDHMNEAGAAAFYVRYTAFLKSNDLME
ncbi:MAG: hypothetical protein IJK64_03380 [Clostridia bacterium]|nr:hypothetical protein [Clostridia bacterium]